MFVGILTIQGVVATSGDTLAVKAGKFMIGSFVPVAGGALADAITAVGGCLTLVKNTVGSFGIIAAIMMILPILAQVLLWSLAVNIAILVSDAFSLKEASGVLRAFSSALSLLLTVLLCYGLLITVSTGIILVITTVSG